MSDGNQCWVVDHARAERTAAGSGDGTAEGRALDARDVARELRGRGQRGVDTGTWTAQPGDGVKANSGAADVAAGTVRSGADIEPRARSRLCVDGGAHLKAR